MEAQNLYEEQLKSHKRNFFIEWTFLIIFHIFLSIFVFSIMYVQYEDILKKEEDRLNTQARVLNNNLTDQITSINELLKSIKQSVEQDGLENSDSRRYIEEHLSTFTNILPSLRTFMILDKEGRVAATNRADVLGFDYSKRDYFLNIKNNPSKSKLYVGKPYNTVLGVWTISFALMICDEKGEFNGLVLTVIEPSQIMKTFESVSYALDMRSSITHGDGTVFLTAPRKDDLLGQNIDTEGSFLQKHKKDGKISNSYKEIIFVSNKERLLTVYTVKPNNIDMDYPLYITISRDLKSLYLDIQKEIYLVVILISLLILSSIVGLFMLQRKRYISRVKELNLESENRKLLEKYAYMDGLTEVANRRYFDIYIDKEWRFCQRKNKELSIILIDIDCFKLYNDKYGHQAGDECLKSVAKTLSKNLKRSHDFVARYGGEEFICVLPNTSLSDAKIICEKLRADVENLQIPHIDSLASSFVTISLGLVTTIPSENKDMKDFIKQADNNLYLAKNSGRNRFCCD